MCVCIPSSRNCDSIGIGLHSPTPILVLILNNCRLRSLQGGRKHTPLPCQFKVHRLVPPKRLNRRTPLVHRSRTKFPEWSIKDEICHSLSTNIHIMGNHLQTGFFQHIHQVRVQPSTIGFFLRPKAGHSPQGPNAKTLQSFYA